MRLQVPLPGTMSHGQELLASSSCLCSELSSENFSKHAHELENVVLLSW